MLKEGWAESLADVQQGSLDRWTMDSRIEDVRINGSFGSHGIQQRPVLVCRIETSADSRSNNYSTSHVTSGRHSFTITKSNIMNEKMACWWTNKRLLNGVTLRVVKNCLTTSSSRGMSLKSDGGSGRSSNNSKHQVPKEVNEEVTTTITALSKKDQLKRAIKDYGATVIVFHVIITLASFSFFYLTVSR